MKARFAVDFDGTLVEDDKYPLIGDWIPGAADAVRRLERLGTVVIFSCRTAPAHHITEAPRSPVEVSREVIRIKDKLAEEGLEHLEVWTKPWKPPAVAYIDNRGIAFRGDWEQTMEDVLDLMVPIAVKAVEAVERVLPLPGRERVEDCPCSFCAPEDDRMHTQESSVSGAVRTFDTGATRDTDDGKLDYEGFFSPAVLKRRAEYMHKHRVQSNGELRDSDNWQKGMPQDEYMKSAFRHFMEWWTGHRNDPDRLVEDAICALMFNCEGYLHELLEEEA